MSPIFEESSDDEMASENEMDINQKIIQEYAKQKVDQDDEDEQDHVCSQVEELKEQNVIP